MKAIAVLFLFAVLASAAVLPPYLPSLNPEELDEQTAAALETLGGVVEDLDDKDEADFDGVSGDEFSTKEETLSASENNEVIYANVTEDGMIEVEDMIVSPEMFDVLFPHVADHSDNTHMKTFHKRAAVSSKSRLWPQGRVAYSYNSNLRGSQAKIREAMDEWQKHTCVKFEYRKSTETRYVQFRTKMDSNGKIQPICSSALGYTRKKQYINLAKSCFSQRTLLHEIGHTLGLLHEHQHPQRGKYVKIMWNNINPKRKGNFKLRSGVSSWGIAYDPLSVMHYRSTAFKKSGCKSPCYTITSLPGVKQQFGTSKTLSARSDIPIVNKMYCSG